jgi:hypothetical protein
MHNLNRSSFFAGVERKTSFAIFIGVFLIALSFAAYTNHAWEDYYITYRPSKNLATGHGLVYAPGERVHTFTSPLNVLVPAILIIITGNTSDELVLWLFRILSCFMLGTAAVLLFNIARKNSLSLIPTVVLIGMFGMDDKIIDFSINGQEIGFMMLFLALTLNALMVSSRWTTLKLGLAWAGLMWTRPDGFIYAGAIALGFLVFDAGQPIAKSRIALVRIYLNAAVITTILYLPWFLWAWHYYGSPIPYPVVAKGLNMDPLHFGSFLKNLLTFPLRMLVGQTPTDATFLPTYAFSFEDWHYTVYIYSRFLSWMCALYWCLPFGRSQARAVSFAFMVGHLYISDIIPEPYPWYIPSCTILGILVLSHIVQQSLDFFSLLKGKIINDKSYSRWKLFIHIFVGSTLFITLLLTLCSGYQLRIQQRLIEEGNRKQIGLWLRQNAASTKDTVFLETFGYIGYFSQLKMLDWPGLSSPEVVAARRKTQSENWSKLIPELQPDWLVLRPYRANEILKENPSVIQRYSLIKVFDVSEHVKSYRWLPGRDYLVFDRIFLVFKLIKDHKK